MPGRSFRGKLRASLLVSVLLVAGATAALAQNKDEKAPPPPSIDAATGKVLSEAIELLNTENYKAAADKIATLKLEELSPFERSKVEQILISISIANEDYAGARRHIEAAIAAGGLNEQEISQIKYQRAQLFIQEENWKEGAKALEEWIAAEPKPNSAAYYLLAIAYYQMEDLDRALAPAKKAVELMDKPQEGWINLLVALYLQKSMYREAVPHLEKLIAVAPTKKNYWLQLSAVYQQLEEYGPALALTQLAYDNGLLDEDNDLRRLADLQLFNGVPYRCGLLLEGAIEKKRLKVDDKAYEKLANCWIAAGEFDKSIAPLQRAGEISGNGDMYVRLGEIHVQREDWPAAVTALREAIDKGKLKDAANAQLLMGISLYNQKKYKEALGWFERLPKTEKYRQMSAGYIQLIQNQLQQAELEQSRSG
ncbi:MAG: tetratricopeptide repeat protein [Rhodospirillaceae bacterium]|nr:tetratricopeptide repeat protein [Rhodospirillaceae bacterium]